MSNSIASSKNSSVQHRLQQGLQAKEAEAWTRTIRENCPTKGQVQREDEIHSASKSNRKYLFQVILPLDNDSF